MWGLGKLGLFSFQLNLSQDITFSGRGNLIQFEKVGVRRHSSPSYDLQIDVPE